MWSLEYPEGKYDDISALPGLPHHHPGLASRWPCGDISTVEYITTLPIITRQEGSTASPYGHHHRFRQVQRPKEIDARTPSSTCPRGVLGVGMMDESTAEGLESMATAIAAGIFLVFLVMAIQFDSPRLSIMVMMCIPLSLIGSIGLVFLNGRPMSIVGLMGFLMLIGIAVNNGIYWWTAPTSCGRPCPWATPGGGGHHPPAPHPDDHPHYHHLHGAHDVLHRQRYGHDEGYAYVMVGGLVASTILAMFLMPAFYLLIRRDECGRRPNGAANQRASED